MKNLKFKPEKKREPRILTKIILTVPAILSTVWLIQVTYRIRNPILGEDGLFLAPPADSNMLIAALSIFTAGYVIFLLMMFSEDIKGFFAGNRTANLPKN